MSRLNFLYRGKAVIVPPEPSVYPQGVIDLGLQAVWDLKDTAGATLSSLYTPAANPGQLPAGTSVSTGPGQVQLPASGTYGEISRFNFSGYQVEPRGSGVGSISQSYFANPGGTRLFISAGTSDVSIDRCTFTGASVTNDFAALVTPGTGTTFALTNSKLQHAPMAILYSFAASTLVEDCYMSDVGENPIAVDPHLEMARSDKGDTIYRRSFFDMSTLNPTGVTGILYFEANTSSGGPITVLIENCILAGSAIWSLLYTLQVAGKGQNVSITINDCAIENGITGPIGITETSGGNVTIAGMGNLDLHTGLPLVLPT